MNNQRTNMTTPGSGTAPTVQDSTNADSVYNNTPTTTSSVQTHTQQSTSASGSLGEKVGGGVKDAFAGIHGAGESLRGGLNAAVDKAFGTDEGLAKDDAIAARGEREMRTGQFTKNA